MVNEMNKLIQYKALGKNGYTFGRRLSLISSSVIGIRANCIYSILMLHMRKETRPFYSILNFCMIRMLCTDLRSREKRCQPTKADNFKSLTGHLVTSLWLILI